jgi:two-component system, NtrC family, sensor kinase
MKQLIIGIFLFTFNIALYGQGYNESLISLIDSLKLQIGQTQNDSIKAEIYNKIAENYLYNSPDSTIYYAEKALILAEKIKNVSMQMGAMGFTGGALIYKGNLPKALELGFRAIDMGKNIPPRAGASIGPTYYNMGEIYSQIGDYNKALQYLKKLISFGEGDLVGVAYGYYRAATVYEKIDQLDSALIYLDQSYKTFSKINHSYYPKVYDVYPGWYNVRAKVYLKQKKPDLALKDLKTTLQMTLRNNEAYHSSNSYNDISAYYQILNQPDSVISYAEKGLAEANKISYTQGILNACEILAEQYEVKDPAKALYYFKLAAETRNKLYGAGNIQIIRDMIAQNEKKQEEIKAAKTAFQNRLRMNAILGITFTLLIIAIFLFRNNRIKQKAKLKIEKAYDLLKSTQSQLIQSEKMASLGELTAGIAHEIQNPLNFVNNFSEISNELLHELKEELATGNLQLATELSEDVIQNLEKINHHGKRASGIVKGMLEHSRTSDGKKELIDLNALADEYLRLAYHGLKAKDKSFNADFKTDFDPYLPKINIIPQDIGRVLLNLINNAFYAVQAPPPPDGGIKNSQTQYMPSVTVSTSFIPPSGERGGL